MVATAVERIAPEPEVAVHDPGEDLLAWMARQFTRAGDSYDATIYGTRAFVTRDPRHARHVLVENPQNYVKGRLIKRVALLLGNGLMTSEGALWQRQRRMIQPAFQRKTVAGLIPALAAPHRELRERWLAAAERGETINLTRDLGCAVLAAVLRAIFGADYAAAAPHFALLAEDAGRSMAFAEAFRRDAGPMLELVARRREQPHETADLLDLLLDARGPDGAAMSARQLLNEIVTLVVAGHETTASTLNWAWYLISQHPEVEARLHDELDAEAVAAAGMDALPPLPYTRQVIEETLRLYPAGWLLTRRALGEDRLGDRVIAAGTEVYIPPYFIQRHPLLWPDPERFDPGRFAAGASAGRPRLAMLPFSAGPRGCIGEHFARLHLQLHLVTIARALRLRYVATGPVELAAGVNLRSRHDFVMQPQCRQPGRTRRSPL